MRQLAGQATRRTAGALLVCGFAVLVPAVVLAVASQTGTDYVPPTFSARAGSALMVAAMSLTLSGLVVFGFVLWNAHDGILTGFGMAAYGTAAVAWIAATVRALVSREWTYGLEQVSIVAAALSMLAYGAAVVRTGAIPRWVGWLAMGWSALWLIRFALPHEGYPPMVHQLIPPLFGVLLLRTLRPPA